MIDHGDTSSKDREYMCSGKVNAQDLIITSIILNLLRAFKAWGWLAGIIIISPRFRRWKTPEIETSTSPSKTCTRASKGAICSLRPCPPSKAKRVTVPVGLRIISLYPS
jgi:hypothetical protein